MATVLEELVTVLGFEFEGDGLDDFNKATEEAARNLKSIVKLGSVAAASVGVFVTAVNIATDSTFKFSKTIGASFDAVQRLAFAGDIWGASMNDVQATLTSLTTVASRAAREGSAIFGFLGISPTANGRIKESVELLSEIADRIKDLPEARQLDLTGQLGISPNMLLLMRKGSAEIRRLGTELDEIGFILNKEQAETAEAFVDATVRAKLAVRGLANQIGIRLAPVFIDAVETMLEWVRASKEMIDSNLDLWAVRVTGAMKPLLQVLGLVSAALTILRTRAILAGATFAAPFVALFLILEDLDKSIKNSVIKQFFDDVGDRVNRIKSILSDINEAGFSEAFRKNFPEGISLGSFTLGGGQSPFAGGLSNESSGPRPSTTNNTEITFNGGDPVANANELQRRAPHLFPENRNIK